MDKKSQQLRKQVYAHARRVCKDVKLRRAVMNFYDNLAEHYSGEVFTRDNFETLTVDDTTYEQDVAKSVFSSKSTATAEEVFAYLFINDVKKVAFNDKKNPAQQGVGGVYESEEKCIFVRMPEVSEYFEKKSVFEPMQMRPAGISDRQWQRMERKREIRQAFKQRSADRESLDNAIAKRDQVWEHFLNHELSHVFELKSFAGDKYFKNNMSDRVFTRGKIGEYISGFNNNFSEENWQDFNTLANSRGKTMENVSAQQFIIALVDAGVNAISEIHNEVFASEIDKTSSVIETAHTPYMSDKYYSKSERMGECGYNVNDDVASLIGLALGDMDKKNCRFNTIEVINRLSNLNVSQTVLGDITSRYAELMLNSAQKEHEKVLMQEVAGLLPQFNSYELIGAMMGCAEVFSFKNQNAPQNATDYKVLVQSLLVESVKNDWLDKMNDPKVEKNAQFFAELNAAMETIDRSIYFPAKTYKFVGRDPKNDRARYQYHDASQIASVARSAHDFPEEKQVVAFNELCEAAKEQMELHKDIRRLDEIMSFVSKQNEKDTAFENLEIQQKIVMQEEKQRADASRQRIAKERTLMEDEW